MKKTKLHKAFGTIVVLASFGYLLRSVLRLDFSQLKLDGPYLAALSFAPLLLIHLTALILVAYNWKLVLGYVRRGTVSFHELLPVFFRSNIAKYLPGSVFEFASRNFLGSKLGWKHSDILLSSFIEIVLSLFLFGLLLTAGMVAFGGDIPRKLLAMISQDHIIRLAVVGCVALAIITAAVYFSVKFREKLRSLLSPRFAVILFKFSSLGMIIFGLAALSFSGIFYFILPRSLQISDFHYITLIFLVSNLIGYIVPVAPAGIGVRESFLILLLSPQYGKTVVTTAALIYRVLTVSSDAIGYLLGLLIEKKYLKDSQRWSQTEQKEF